MKYLAQFLTNSKQFVSISYYQLINYTIVVDVASRNYEYLVYLLDGVCGLLLFSLQSLKARDLFKSFCRRSLNSTLTTAEDK